MNEENKTPEVNPKLRKYITVIGTCMIALAVLMVAVSDRISTDSERTTLAMPTTLANQVEAQVRDEPDTRNNITIIIKTTFI